MDAGGQSYPCFLYSCGDMPVLEYGARTRSLYLPAGTWKEIHTKMEYVGGQTVIVAAPLNYIPVFERNQGDL